MSLSFTFLFILSTHLSLSLAQSATKDSLQTYIVHVDRSSAASLTAASSADDVRTWYKSFLPTTTASPDEPPRLLYAYKNVATAFAARYTEQELAELKQKPGFIHAYPDRIASLQTTRSPEFLGLCRDAPGLWKDSTYGRGIIIGVLDTGLTPHLPSFSAEGMPPPPPKWKGACEFNASASCNNKIIGARNFVKGLSHMGASAGAAAEPYDDDGHGSHTASTAAGAFVDNANVDGQASGTAVGIAPLAHIAIYKVCTGQGCADSDILAGLDAAVEDRVDILSLSIGATPTPFYNDSLAIGAFAAIRSGILVSCAAGNGGPGYQTLTNEAPWLLSVGASTTDRYVPTTVKLGNNVEFTGESAYQPADFPPKLHPLVYPGYLGASDTLCANGSLDGIDVKGMVVVCDYGKIDAVEKGVTVKKAGGVAMIITNLEADGVTTYALSHVLPTSHVAYVTAVSIKSYIRSDPAPTAAIAFKGTILGMSPAPVVASFSSRGPNKIDPNILKPDIIGPGVNILAAYPLIYGSNTARKFNIISGTSMSTPHLSGVAALLKSAHPDWSPAAIKSAIMTTAYLKANDGNPIRSHNLSVADVYTIGAGHVDPSRASNPGLVYDIDPSEYVPYLCGLLYTDQQVSAIVGRSIKCSETGKISSSELNLPSFVVTLKRGNEYTVTVGRTVTNTGGSGCAYTAKVLPPAGAKVTVNPEKLVFSKINEKAKFTISFTGQAGSPAYSQGYLTWISSDKVITVNSPIVVVEGCSD